MIVFLERLIRVLFLVLNIRNQSKTSYDLNEKQPERGKEYGESEIRIQTVIVSLM